MINKNVTHKEIHEQLPDYVLDLLAPRQAELIADHLASCAVCRDAVLGEREIGELIRSTLNASTRPDAARLRKLMPPVPQHKRTSRSGANWTARLAPVLVVLAVILGSFLMSTRDSERSMSLFGGATATATSTNTPTATIDQQSGSAGAQTTAKAEDSSLAIPISMMESTALAVAAPVPILSPTPVVASSYIAAN